MLQKRRLHFGDLLAKYLSKTTMSRSASKEKPETGVADRLVKKMKKEDERRVKKFEWQLEDGLIMKPVQRPYDQEVVADWLLAATRKGRQ